MLKSNPGLMPILREGEIINVRVIERANKAVYFAVPRIGTGVIYGLELINARNILKKLEEGDEIAAKVIMPENEDGFVELSLVEAGKQKAWQELKELKDADEAIKGKIVNANSGGLIVDIRGIQGFLPASQLSNDNYPKDAEGDRSKIIGELEKMVGGDITVKIININPRTNKLIVSEREVEVDDVKELLSKYSEGEDVSGIVSGVADFGAFIKFADEPKIEGLIHISELSYNIIDNPKEIVSVGDMVKAKITEIKDGRVSLSLRALQEDPWEEADKKFKAGEIIEGEVYKLNPFGASVRLGHGLTGMIHVSEFGSVEELKKHLNPGQTYKFLVDSVKADEKRITLKLEKGGTKQPEQQKGEQEVSEAGE
ncbi:MAG: 30S ribosomal protein S1 [Candidatus Colwellbacteria bacterium CG10_big_fil_rev_8_21_14_0_10_41_28]|uniref:30S ribosomal protein S1 n=1 Tax=Candidatus Colwellbacteria bacterium CG10_big_fil_rev_8_21_14_0_10_41_28 TaxID=1974539 RepID=A0A2H0VH64_9BACT|nr:MAG: 30S ribosomal protein S1 [Candidatus Colwellbacteria bacterium CG10_big_fil_rev_8_21_14_0_10_41_28]